MPSSRGSKGNEQPFSAIALTFMMRGIAPRSYRSCATSGQIEHLPGFVKADARVAA